MTKNFTVLDIERTLNKGARDEVIPRQEENMTKSAMYDGRRSNKQCFYFAKYGGCNKKYCGFYHSWRDQSQTRPTQDCVRTRYENNNSNTNAKCTWCGFETHEEAQCLSKKAGYPRISEMQQQNLPSGMGVLTQRRDQEPSSPAVMTFRTNNEAKQNQIMRRIVMEKFYVDTGANRTVHPNPKAANKYMGLQTDISTASGDKTLKSDGIGTLKLCSASGTQINGFNRVIFCKEVSHKLLSVGELCDAGYMFVFDDKSVKMFNKKDLNIDIEPIASGERESKSQLYPITFFRDATSNLNAEQEIKAEVKVEAKAEPISFLTNIGNEQLPDFITGPCIPTVLLAKSYIKPGLSDLDRYHAKFGDVGVKYLQRCKPELKVPKEYRCEECIEGKIHKFGHKAVEEGVRRNYEPGVCIHTDHSGPYAKSLSGARYSQLYLDRGSGYLWARRQKNKTDHYEHTPKIFVDSWGISGRKVQILQTDGDSVFTSQETRDMLEQNQVRHEWSAPYDSNTNAFIERARRTIFEGVSTSLIRSGAPARFWGEAENHKIYTMNILPTVEDPEQKGEYCSRRNLLEGNRRPANLEKLMAFGTAATCYVPVDKRRGGKEPAQRRSFKGAILGYEDGMPAYRVWDLVENKIVLVSYNFAICHEGYYPFKDKKNWPKEYLDDPECFAPTLTGVVTTTDLKKYNFDEEQMQDLIGNHSGLVIEKPLSEVKIPMQVEERKVIEKIPEPESEEAALDFEIKSERLHKFWKDLLDDVEATSREEKVAMMIMTQPNKNEDLITKEGLKDKPLGIPPPENLGEARRSPWWKHYKEAAQVEYDGHLKNKTWELVHKSSIPARKNILRGKWVFDDKRGEDGKMTRFKARFVAMGNTQKKGVDYDETYAGVVIGKSFKMMLVVLNEEETNEMEHWDVKMAFTQAALDESEEIYMYQPDLFTNDSENYVCKLKKSLYGLKQSAKNWGDMLRDFLVKSTFTQCLSDPCVYIKKVGSAFCVVSTHVDDIFCLFNVEGKKFRNELFEKISSSVEIENLGPVSWALKTSILRDRKAGLVKISQEGFITDLLKKHGMEEDKNQMVPSSENLYDKSIHSEEEKKVDVSTKRKFQSIIGALWWLTTISRPDIYYAVHRASKMQNEPNLMLKKALDKILQYLASTKHVGIVYRRHSVSDGNFSGFVDAAYGCEKENASRIGYFYLLRGNLISWASETPKRVVTSSTEAECQGLVYFAKENIWQRKLHKELSLYSTEHPTIVYEDNAAAILMANNLGISHKRSKHFDIEFSYFKQSVTLKEVKPIFVPTENQPADMLTKSLPPSKFIMFREMIMGDERLQRYFQM